MADIYIYEKGTYRGAFGAYASGDKLKVAVESGVVKYYRNGTLLYTSTQAPTLPLRADASIYSTGAVLQRREAGRRVGQRALRVTRASVASAARKSDDEGVPGAEIRRPLTSMRFSPYPGPRSAAPSGSRVIALRIVRPGTQGKLTTKGPQPVIRNACLAASAPPAQRERLSPL